MCGITGILDIDDRKRIDEKILLRMINKIRYRGPDDLSVYIKDNLGLGFARLSVIGLKNGKQPLFNEDNSITLVCNGEIFNYKELKETLVKEGHIFKTDSDCEVIIHLYEEYGVDFLNQLNGQFAFVLYDFNKKLLFAARDHFGIAPFFYSICDRLFLFGSEIKAILEHPLVPLKVDLNGLDQIFTFPGLISPNTLFDNITSLPNGHYLTIENNKLKIIKYWDVNYPKEGEIDYIEDENYYKEKLAELLRRSVQYRLVSDVPVGFFVSGGLDSSLIAAQAMQYVQKEQRLSFAINVAQADLSEAKYQRIMAKYLNSKHYEYLFQEHDILSRLKQVIYHCECALKETYNSASLALSEMVRKHNLKVILAGEGADEFFAGYIGYRFDQFNLSRPKKTDSETLRENAIRKKLWGDENFIYEKSYGDFSDVKKTLYSDLFRENLEEMISPVVIDINSIKNINILHKRSYIDYKLRLVDHLLGDHGDKMVFANGVECRYPFLDKDLIEFATLIPPKLKLNNFEEKYILKSIASQCLPQEIVKREKFGFTTPGSPFILSQNLEYINELLSYERIKKEGYFNPSVIESLKKQYSDPNFIINVPFDTDLLMPVITFGIFLETFNLPKLGI